MANFAVIDNGIVVNCIIAENKQIAEDITGMLCVEYFSPKPGDIYDGEKFVDQEIPE